MRWMKKNATPMSTPSSVRAPAPAARRLPNTKGTASSAANRMADVRAMRDQNANSCSLESSEFSRR